MRFGVCKLYYRLFEVPKGIEISFKYRLASIGILGKERETGVGKLGWHGNFDTGFERNISFEIPCVGFLNLFEIATILLIFLKYGLRCGRYGSAKS